LSPCLLSWAGIGVVAEAMRERGWHVEVGSPTENYSDEPPPRHPRGCDWEVEMWSYKTGPGNCVMKVAATAPIAILRAALTAVQTEKRDKT